MAFMQPHKPAGSPGGTGGQFDNVIPGDGLPPMPPQGGTAVAAAGGEGHNPGGDGQPILESAEDTQKILDKTERCDVTPDGVVLRDNNMHILFQETAGHRLDTATLKANPKVRLGARMALRTLPVPGEKARETRRATHQAFRLATAADRHNAIWHSDLVKYIPPSSVVRSLRETRDQKAAVSRFFDIYHANANSAAAIVYRGWPHGTPDKTDPRYATQWQVINGLSAKDTEKALPMRSFLRERATVAHGAPTPREAGLLTRRLHMLRDDPVAQAGMVYDFAYGTGLHGKANAIGGHPWERVYSHYSQGAGNGHMADDLVYSGALTPEAAQIVLDQSKELGDSRTVHSSHAKQQGKGRLNTMRAFIHNRYGI